MRKWLLSEELIFNNDGMSLLAVYVESQSHKTRKRIAIAGNRTRAWSVAGTYLTTWLLLRWLGCLHCLLQNRDSLFNSHSPLPYFIYDEPCNRDRFVARRDVFGQWVDVYEWFYLGPTTCFWIMCRFGLWDWFFLFIPRTPSSPPSLPTPIVL